MGPTIVMVVHGPFGEEGGDDFHFLRHSTPSPPMNTSKLFLIPKSKPHFDSRKRVSPKPNKVLVFSIVIFHCLRLFLHLLVLEAALVVEVEELQGACGVELATVVFKVNGEHSGLRLGTHAEDEGLGSFITGNSGKQNEEENDGRKGIQ